MALSPPSLFAGDDGTWPNAFLICVISDAGGRKRWDEVLTTVRPTGTVADLNSICGGHDLTDED